MTLNEFKTKVRINRGKLSTMDSQLEDIYLNGTLELLHFTMEQKILGIEGIANIAWEDKEYQTKFMKYIASRNNKVNKNDIDLWLASNKESTNGNWRD